MEPKLVRREQGLFLELGKQSLCIDFSDRNYWKPLPKGKQELLSRAIGLNKGYRDVIDATAGLLQDTFVLARLGARVRAIEKSEWIFPLLKSAYENPPNDSKLQNLLSQIQLIQGDAVDFLRSLQPNEYPEVIYLDPMFPESKKTALPKKEMQIFREVVGEDETAATLLSVARQRCTARVVVKRPLKGSSVAEGWLHQLKGKAVRFDIYAPQKERS